MNLSVADTHAAGKPPAFASGAIPSGRLRVLMVSDVCHPRVNGVSTSIETFSGALARLGVRITLVAPEYPGANHALDTAAASCAEVVRLPSRGVPFDPEDRLMHWRELGALDRRLASADFDLVHIQTPFAAHYAGLRFARRRRIPCVATYHTHFEEYLFHYIRFLPRAALRLAARSLARHQCNALDAVVVPSSPMAETLHNYGVRRALHVIPTGLPDSQFIRGNGARFRQQWGIAPTRLIALFVGRAAFEKNIDFLLDAIAAARRKQPHLMLVVAGEGPALPSLRRRAQALRIGDHVRFVGYLARDGGLRDCYAAADVFTFASQTETQGLVLLEAMAIGLPVLAIPALGAAEIIAPARGALPAADTPAEFARQLNQLLDNPQRLEAMSREAIAFARGWDADAQATRLAALYRSLLRAPAPRLDIEPMVATR
ncbi:MAG: glycosyltransferase [Rhodocyclales bacterium]|nr:glycosyltransferase [Rhodocyclales bacterium]